MRFIKVLSVLSIVLLLASCEQVGCTDPASNNYNANAVEGGECTYDNKNYSLWFDTETSDSLVAICPNEIMYIYAIDTNEILDPESDFASYKHVANMDPTASSTEAPDCNFNNFLDSKLRNIRIESSKENGTVLNVYISKSLSTDAPGENLIWKANLVEGTEDCYDVEIEL